MREIMPLAATWMNLEMIKVGEASQTERQAYQISYVQSKTGHKEPSAKQTRPTDTEPRWVVAQA